MLKCNQKRNYWIVLVILLAVGLLTACQPEDPIEPESVTLQLKWVHQAQFAGFYVAEERGYYQEAGLDVTLLPGGPDVDLESSLQNQAADFWIISGEQLLTYREQGLPLVAVAVIYQRNPMVFVSLEEQGLDSPRNLEGAVVGLAPDGEVVFRALVNHLGLNSETIQQVEYDRSYASLKSGEVDFTQAYVTGGVIRLQEEGYQLNLIWPSDYGIDFYADTLVTTEEIIREQPERVRQFVNASLRGWRQAVSDPELAVSEIMKYAVDSDSTIQEKMLANSIPLVHTGEYEIGEMDPITWQNMHDSLLSQEILQEDLPVSSIFTNQFIEGRKGDQ